MKMTEFKEGKTYLRPSDGMYFKKENSKFFIADDKGYWTESDDLSLKDNFKEVSGLNIKKSAVTLYQEFRSGDVEVSKRSYDMLMHRVAQMVDEWEKAKSVKSSTPKRSKKSETKTK